jgi:hypothetical protein
MSKRRIKDNEQNKETTNHEIATTLVIEEEEDG